MSEVYLSIDDTVRDLEELTLYGKFIIGVNDKEIHKIEKCIKKLKEGDYKSTIKKSLLEDGEIC